MWHLRVVLNLIKTGKRFLPWSVELLFKNDFAAKKISNKVIQ